MSERTVEFKQYVAGLSKASALVQVFHGIIFILANTFNRKRVYKLLNQEQIFTMLHLKSLVTSIERVKHYHN